MPIINLSLMKKKNKNNPPPPLTKPSSSPITNPSSSPLTKTSSTPSSTPSSALSQPSNSNIFQNNSPSLGTTIMQGFSFGTGSAVAHGVVDSLFKEKKSEVINNQDKCEIFNKELTECLKQSINNEQCIQLHESYQKCLKN